MDATSTSSKYDHCEVSLSCGSDVAAIVDLATMSLKDVAMHTMTWHPHHKIM